jgi:hypothetical protein
VTAWARIVLAVAVPILVAGVFFTRFTIIGAVPVAAPARPAADIALSADSRSLAADMAEPEPGPNGFVDMYGNEVTDAIATYTFDQTGSLYELHSPQTELPRLGIPKS